MLKHPFKIIIYVLVLYILGNILFNIVSNKESNDNSSPVNNIESSEATSRKKEEEVIEKKELDGVLFERVIGEKCSKISDKAHQIMEIIDANITSNDNKLSRSKRKEIIKLMNEIVTDYNYIVAQDFPVQHTSVYNGLICNCKKPIELYKNFEEDYNNYVAEDYYELSNESSRLSSATEDIFYGYRIRVSNN